MSPAPWPVSHRPRGAVPPPAPAGGRNVPRKQPFGRHGRAGCRPARCARGADGRAGEAGAGMRAPRGGVRRRAARLAGGKSPDRGRRTGRADGSLADGPRERASGFRAGSERGRRGRSGREASASAGVVTPGPRRPEPRVGSPPGAPSAAPVLLPLLVRPPAVSVTERKVTDGAGSRSAGRRGWAGGPWAQRRPDEPVTRGVRAHPHRTPALAAVREAGAPCPPRRQR